MIIPVQIDASELVKRYTRCDAYGRCYNYNSNWYSWQRWVVLGVVLIASLLLICLCSGLSARRRKKRGLNPYYGTGWAAYGAPPAYNVNNTSTNTGHTGPQYGGQTGYNSGTQYANYGEQPASGYYGNNNTNPNYEMGGGYNNNNNGPIYNPPNSPPPAHVSKY